MNPVPERVISMVPEARGALIVSECAASEAEVTQGQTAAFEGSFIDATVTTSDVMPVRSARKLKGAAAKRSQTPAPGKAKAKRRRKRRAITRASWISRSLYFNSQWNKQLYLVGLWHYFR